MFFNHITILIAALKVQKAADGRDIIYIFLFAQIVTGFDYIQISTVKSAKSYLYMESLKSRQAFGAVIKDLC